MWDTRLTIHHLDNDIYLTSSRKLLNQEFNIWLNVFSKFKQITQDCVNIAYLF